MKAFQILLGIFFAGILTFTAAAVSKQGWNLVPLFVNEITAMTWQGQFNFDFSCYLMLSALWILWRHEFSGMGFLLAGIASVAGILFFAPYLLIQSIKAKGDMIILLVGDRKLK
jgi:hypothetical protein